MKRILLWLACGVLYYAVAGRESLATSPGGRQIVAAFWLGWGLFPLLWLREIRAGGKR